MDGHEPVRQPDELDVGRPVGEDHVTAGRPDYDGLGVHKTLAEEPQASAETLISSQIG